MKDIEFEARRRTIDPVWRTIKREALDLLPRDADRSDLIEFAKRRTELRRAMAAAGPDWFEEFYFRHMLPDKAGPPGSKKDDPPPTPFLDLGEVMLVHSETDGEGIPRTRGDLTKAEMIEIGKRKQRNISTAVHAKKQWDWECQLVFPFFEAHPDWTYRQCYDAVCTQLGHEPEIPKFD